MTVGPGAQRSFVGASKLSKIALDGSRFALSTSVYAFKYAGTTVSSSVQETKAYQAVMALRARRNMQQPSEEAAQSAGAAEQTAQVKQVKAVLGTVVTSCLGVFRTVKAAGWAFTGAGKQRRPLISCPAHVVRNAFVCTTGGIGEPAHWRRRRRSYEPVWRSLIRY